MRRSPGLEPGALVSRAHPAPGSDPDRGSHPHPVPRGTPEQWLSKYALPKLPERIQRIWNQFIDWRRKERHYLNGELFVVSPSRGGRQHGQEAPPVVLRYFGWSICSLPSAADRDR